MKGEQVSNKFSVRKILSVRQLAKSKTGCGGGEYTEQWKEGRKEGYWQLLSAWVVCYCLCLYHKRATCSFFFFLLLSSFFFLLTSSSFLAASRYAIELAHVVLMERLLLQQQLCWQLLCYSLLVHYAKTEEHLPSPLLHLCLLEQQVCSRSKRKKIATNHNLTTFLIE